MSGTGLATALQSLPALPDHFNPIRALPKEDREKLLDTILAHYENGESIYRLAEILGVNNATLYRQLVKHRSEDWIEVRAARYHSDVEEAEKEMKEASDPLAVTRARERLANARWMLERLQRKIYGADQVADQGGRVSISINLGVASAQQTPVDAGQHGVIIDADGADRT